MVDPGTGLALFGLAKVLKKPAAAFAARVLGPATDVLGKRLAERVEAWTAPRAAEIMDGAFELVEASGREPHAVPPRLLLPLMDGAVLEEDAEMRALWIALLANASLDSDGSVRPQFVSLLNQMSSADALVLQSIAAIEAALNADSAAEDVVLSAAAARLQLRPEVFQVSVNAVVAFGLVSDIPTIRWDKQTPAQYFGDESVRLSPLGRAFIAACTPPSRAAA